MKFPRYILGCGLILLAAFVLASEQAEVKRVIDGDTVELKDGRSVRLIGVNCPDPTACDQWLIEFCDEAKEFLRKLCEGKSVRLEYDRDTIDTYGRTLAYLYLDDETLINAEIIRNGYGYADSLHEYEKRAEFLEIEMAARQDLRGLWRPALKVRMEMLRRQSLQNDTVYVTDTGDKYHRRNCWHLKLSCTALSLADALALGKTPCKVCRPYAPPTMVRVDTVYDTVQAETASSPTGAFPWLLVIVAIVSIAVGYGFGRLRRDRGRLR